MCHLIFVAAVCQTKYDSLLLFFLTGDLVLQEDLK